MMNRLLLLFLLLLAVPCSAKRKLQPPQKQTAESASLEKDYLLVEAVKYHTLGDASTAIALVNQAVLRDSLCAACYYLQSDIYAGAGMYKDAILSADRARSLDTANEWYAVMQATVNMRMGNLPQSIQQFEKVLNMKGYSSSVYMNLANLYGASGSFDQAMAMLDTLENHEGYNEQVSLTRQHIYYQNGNTEESLAEALKLNDFSPNNPQFITLLGDAYSRDGDIAKAKTCYSQALQIDSLYPPAQLGMLDTYRKSNSYMEFFGELKKICLNSRLSLEEKSNYLSLIVSDPTLEAVGIPWLNDIFGSISSAYPNDWNFTLLYISYLVKVEQVEEAVAVMEAYMARPNFKDSYDTQEVYLSLLNSAQKWEKLVTKSDEALKSNKSQVQLYMFKGVALWQLSKYNEAANALSRGLKYAADTVQKYDIYSLMGDIYNLGGNKKKSYASFEKAIEINPKGAMALNNYAYYLSEEGERLPDALKMAKTVMEVEPNNPTFLDTYGWILYKMGLYDEAKSVFRQAMLYGGRTEWVLLDHYGDVLFALKEYDTAILYYDYALEAVGCKNPEAIKTKIEKAKSLK